MHTKLRTVVDISIDSDVYRIITRDKAQEHGKHTTVTNASSLWEIVTKLLVVAIKKSATDSKK